MPSLCPNCGRMYCDHEPEERGQTFEEMMREPTAEELLVFGIGSAQQKLELAQRNAHLPVDVAQQ